MKRTPVVLAALLAVAPAHQAAAQSFLGFRALGVPVGASGGRAIALGNLGIGLAQVEVSATDPSASARLLFPTVAVSMQPTWGDFDLDGQSGTARTTRFPLIGIGYPVVSARGTVTLSLAGYMEQRWVGQRRGVVTLGGSEVTIDDRFETDGGTSVARLGWAQRLDDRFSVGVAAGAYVGRVDREFDRALDSLAVGGDVRSYVEASSWQYSGFTLATGFAADPHDLIHVAGAMEWSGDLKETPKGETAGDQNVYTIPLRLSAGATGRLTQRLNINTSIVYQDWSGADGFTAGVTSQKKLSYGVGLELRAIQGENRSFPLRFGYRHVVPPFRYEADDPVESVWSLGIGLNLVEVEGIRFGWMDLGFERGNRYSAPLDERFWRATVSLGISRF